MLTMRKLTIVVGVLLAVHVALLFVRPSGSARAAGGGETVGNRGLNVGIVLDIGGLGDKSFNDGAYKGAMMSSAIAYVIFAYSSSLWLLFLSRFVQGSGGGTVGVIQAYVADAVEPSQRAKGLGWLSAATNAGVALGPVIGSQMLHFGRHAPGLAAAALCVLNSLFALKYLVESRDMKRLVPSVVRGRSRCQSSRSVGGSTDA